MKNLNGMFDMSKMMNRFFRPVENVVWDLMTGGIGIKVSDGIATMEGEGDDAQITINSFEQFGMPIPAFAQNTPIASVAIGDVIFTTGQDSSVGWVTKKTEKSITLMRPNGSFSKWNPPKTTMIFGPDSGVMVLRSLMSMLPGGQAGLGNFNSMLMPMMVMSGGDLDFDSIIPMMLMSQMGAPVVAKDAEGNEIVNQQPGMLGQNMAQMMPMMMMMSMMKGNGTSGGGKGFFDNRSR